MSQDSPSPPPPESASTPGATPDKPARSPAERIVVWGLILVMLAVVGGEAMARFGYENSLNRLQTAMEGDKQGQPLMVADIGVHIGGFPSREQDEQNRVITYHWASPIKIKSYGKIHLTYSKDNEVLSLLTDNPPEEPKPQVRPGSDEESEDYGMDEGGEQMAGGQGGPGGGGPGGGGPGGGGFDPMQFDADGDGKISRDEAPQRMQERFDDIDTNGDGFADAEEFEARRAAFRGVFGGGERGDGGERGGRPDRPQRPDTEGEGENAADDAESTAPASESTEPATDESTNAEQE